MLIFYLTTSKIYSACDFIQKVVKEERCIIKIERCNTNKIQMTAAKQSQPSKRPPFGELGDDADILARRATDFELFAKGQAAADVFQKPGDEQLKVAAKILGLPINAVQLLRIEVNKVVARGDRWVDLHLLLADTSAKIAKVIP